VHVSLVLHFTPNGLTSTTQTPHYFTAMITVVTYPASKFVLEIRTAYFSKTTKYQSITTQSHDHIKTLFSANHQK